MRPKENVSEGNGDTPTYPSRQLEHKKDIITFRTFLLLEEKKNK